MNCSRFETLLSEFLERRLDHRVSTTMQAHLAECPGCSRLVDEVRRLQEEVAAFPEIRVSPLLIERILEQTSGKKTTYSFWKDLLLPTLKPFLSPRYTFATLLMFVFLSLMANVLGPEFSAFSQSRGSASLTERADRISSQIYSKWMQFNEWKTRATQELKLLKEDLFGRIDYHLITILFESYNASLEDAEDTEDSRLNGTQQDESKEVTHP